MLCPQCNQQVEPGTKFCSMCGAAIEQTPSYPAAPPVFNENSVSAPSQNLSKWDYFLRNAKGKKLNILSWIVALLCVVITAVTVLAPLSISMFDIPLLTLAEDEFILDKAIPDELEDYDFDEQLEIAEDTLNRGEYKLYESAVNACEDLLDHFSLFNVKITLECCEEMLEDDDIQAFSNGDFDDMVVDKTNAIINIILCVCIAFGLFCALFIVLAVLFKLWGLVIPALLLLTGFGALLSGGLYVALTLVGFIALIVVLILCSKAYKNSAN